MRFKSLVYCAVFLLATPEAAPTQSLPPSPSPSATPTAFQLEDVVVTAHRRRTPLNETGSSISVLSAAVLVDRQTVNLCDALRDLPSLGIIQTGGPGKTTTTQIRGTGSERALVLVDGAEMNDPMSTGRTFNFSDLTVDNVERVEVLRGPQSTLYGPDASGGVIQVFTRRGEGPVRASLTGESGGYGEWRTMASVSGGTSMADFSGSFSRWGMNGFSVAPANFPNQSALSNPYANNTYSARLGLSPQKSWRLDLSGRLSDSVNSIDNSFGYRDDPNHIFSSRQGSLRGEGSLDLAKGKIRLWGGATRTLSRYQDDNDPDADHPDESLRSAYRGDTWRADLVADIRFARASSLLAGVERKMETGESTYLSVSGWGPYQDDFTRRRVGVNGLFAEHHLSWGERLHFWSGFRRDDHESFGGHTTFRFSASSFEKTTRLRFRASLGTGWKTPTLYQLYSSYGNPSLRPEENRAWDAGIERSWRRDKFRVKISYFKNSFRDFLDFDNNAFVYLNLPRAETRGAEVETVARPSSKTEWRWAYTRTIANNGETGDLLLRRPSYQHVVGGDVTLARGLKAGLDARFVGTRMDVVFPPWPDTAFNIPLAPYSIWTIRASYSVNAHIRFFGRCENLFDRRYEEVRGFATAGRTFFAGSAVSL